MSTDLFTTHVMTTGANILRNELGYCSNVHPGESIRDVMRNLEMYVAPLRRVRNLDKSGALLSFADLPLFLAQTQEQLQEFQSLHIHFHVPLHQQSLLLPGLKTSYESLLRVFDFLKDRPAVRPMLEVETYSWQVLPESLRPASDDELIMGIADELGWVEHALAERSLLLLA